MARSARSGRSRTVRGTAAACLSLAALAGAGVLVVGFAPSSSAAAPPVNTQKPSVEGVSRAGETLTAQPGTWTGDTPITFTYVWQRCDAHGASCADAANGKSQTYTLGSADVGNTLRVVVTATNAGGVGTATSDVSAVVSEAPVDAPAPTAPPNISGTPETGSTLSATTGTFSGAAPLTYTYVWQKCDANGGACQPIPNATQANYVLATTDAGATFRVVVTARNAAGSASATSVPTARIVAGQTGIVTLPSGQKSVPADTLALPTRLLISRVAYAPPELRTRSPFTVKVQVQDTRGFVVRGAKVFILGVPYSRVATVPERTTGQDGSVTFVVHPLSGLELGRGKYLVFFVRATGPTGSQLGGISTRRLVQLRTGPPA